MLLPFSCNSSSVDAKSTTIIIDWIGGVKEMDILIKFGETVRNLRQSKQISQEQFADLCGLHRTYISDIELGKRNVSLENIEKIAKALDLTISQLFAEVG